MSREGDLLQMCRIESKQILHYILVFYMPMFSGKTVFLVFLYSQWVIFWYNDRDIIKLSVIFLSSSCAVFLTLLTRRLAFNIKKRKLDIPEPGKEQNGLMVESEIFVSKYKRFPTPLKVTPMVKRKVSRLTSMAQKQMASETNEIKNMSRTVFA